MNQPKISREQFIRQYCERSGIAPSALLKRRRVVRCTCGEPQCDGWVCIPRETDAPLCAICGHTEELHTLPFLECSHPFRPKQ